MSVEVWFTEQADVALRALEADPSVEALLVDVNRVLVMLEVDPTQQAVRRRLYTDGTRRVDLWRFDWMVLWSLWNDGVLVRHIGPAL